MKRKSLFLLLLVLAFFHSCIEKEKEQIFIDSVIPQTIKLGSKDTFLFKITSRQPIDTVKVKDEKTIYAAFDNKTFGGSCYYWEVNLVYNPDKTGIKTMEFYVRAGGIYIKKYPFSILVEE